MTKERTNIYLDSALKEEAKKFFEGYGLNFSSGISFLLRQTLEKKSLSFDKLNIEPVYPDEADYRLMRETDGEKAYPLDEVMKEFGC